MSVDSTTAFVCCETSAAITIHIREVTETSPIKLGGHWPRPSALCSAAVSWDITTPLEAARCRRCIDTHRNLMLGAVLA